MNHQQITIRYATPGDEDQLVELLRELFSIEVDFDFDEIRQRNGLKLMLDGCRKHKCLLVAEAGGNVVGMCSAQIRISTAQGENVAVIEDVVVKKEWRGKGIGRKLMEEIENWGQTRNIRHFQLLADQTNLPGLAFYQKQNWRMTRLVCLTKDTTEKDEMKF